MTWLWIAGAVEALALLVALSLCKAAARGDRREHCSQDALLAPSKAPLREDRS